MAISCRYCPFGNEDELSLPEIVVNGVMDKLGYQNPPGTPRWWCDAKHCQVDPDKPRFCATRTALMKKSKFKIIDLTK